MTSAYIDASVLLRIILDEPGALKDVNKFEEIYSSWLIRVESHRVLQRLLKNNQITESKFLKSVEILGKLLTKINIIEINKTILTRSEESFPLQIGTLDAIHLASALSLREHQIYPTLLTHDIQLGNNALAMQFSVNGI